MSLAKWENSEKIPVVPRDFLLPVPWRSLFFFDSCPFRMGDEYSGVIIDSTWVLTSVLSRGGFSVVYEGHDVNKKLKVAIKTAPLKTEDEAMLDNEWEVYRDLKGEST